MQEQSQVMKMSASQEQSFAQFVEGGVTKHQDAPHMEVQQRNKGKFQSVQSAAQKATRGITAQEECSASSNDLIALATGFVLRLACAFFGLQMTFFAVKEDEK